MGPVTEMIMTRMMIMINNDDGHDDDDDDDGHDDNDDDDYDDDDDDVETMVTALRRCRGLLELKEDVLLTQMENDDGRWNRWMMDS